MEREQYKKLKASVYTAQLVINTELNVIDELRAAQRRQLSKMFNVEQQHVFVGTQDCIASPTGTHVYDLNWDPNKVRCLFEPHR